MKKAKNNALNKLQDLNIGIIRRFESKTEIYSVDSKFIYMRTANAQEMKDSTKKYWYGIPKPIIDKYNKFGKLFIFLVMDDGTNTILIPATEFVEMMRGVEVDMDNRWKPFLFVKENKATITIKGKTCDVSKYLDNFITFSDYVAPEKIKEPSIKIPTPSREIEKSLLEIIVDYSTKGEFYKEFENVVFNAFLELGFECEWISEGTKSGDTDILIKNPYRVIVDAKTRSSGSLSEINFTRLKRHKDNNNAKYILVVGPDFDPALCRDAEREGVCLLTAGTLRRILELNKDFSLSPADLEDIISTHGLLDNLKLEQLKVKHDTEVFFVKRLLIVMEELENPQSLDTLYGVMRTRDRYEKQPKIDKAEIEQILSLLMMPPISAVKLEADGRYVRIREISDIKRKVASWAALIGKLLVTETGK